MADKNELELDQEALDKLMQGVSPGIQPWVEEEEELSAKMPEKEKTDGKLNEAPTPVLLYLGSGLQSPYEVNPWYDEIKAHTGRHSTAATHKGYITKQHPELAQPIEEFASILENGYFDNFEDLAQARQKYEEFNSEANRGQWNADTNNKLREAFHSLNAAKLKLLEDQIMKKYNLPEKIDVFTRAEPTATQTMVQDVQKEKPAEKSKTAKEAPRAKTTYGKDQLDGFLKAYDVYLKAPNDVQNHDLLKELDPNYESVHGDLFADSVEKGSADIAAFADGYLDIDSDAIDSMQKYIETFGKEYNKGSYEYTPAAQKALDRLKDLRQQAQEKAKQQQAQKADTEKSKTAKIKELMKKKPQDRTLQDYLFLKEAIEQNPRRTPEQKAKDIESLTSQARTRMKEPNKVKDEELVVVPLFIDAFGYDKGRAINKDARSFRDAMAKRTPPAPNKTQDGIVSEPVYTPGEAVQTSDNKKAQPQKEDKKKKKGGVFAWFGKAKDWVKKHAAPIVVGVLATAALLSGYGKKGAGDKDKKENKIENVAKTYDGGQLPEVTITPEHIDVNMLKQYGKRIAHQEKLSTEDAVKRTMSDLEAFKNLPDEMKAKFAGQSDEEKLAKLGVVRGDQDKLHKPIDSLLKGEKINPLTLKDISERTFKVTDDFGANKDNSLKNGKQSKDMSAYQFLKILNEKGMTGK